MFWHSALATLLATGAQASLGSLLAENLSRDSPAYHRRMEEISKQTLAIRGMLEARQSMTAGSNVQLNSDGSINMTAWDAQATAACESALNHLPEASNPSGTCICYNLPALDNTTGTFEADLRLYQLSTASGQFTGIPPQNIQVGLSYRGASVSPVSAQTAAKKVLAQRQIDISTANVTSNLKLLQTYLFVGQIDKAQMQTTMTTAQLEALVMPVVTLSAVNAAGQTVSTNVSSNEAAFVAGVFSQEIIMSTSALAQVAVDDQVIGLANGTVAFVLPGVNILIFPIGLIVTGTWMVLGLAVYGAGTVARIGFADSFKRRAQVANKSSVSRI
ncbi:hypothetical protein GQ53DRAFT_665020 [Thozetella sp. PMI_491]|nr:hypothetical protein GQ53DRAFT_665020 [Thozetella sp. PMI_491]